MFFAPAVFWGWHKKCSPFSICQIDKLPFGKEYGTVILEYNSSISLASFISAKGIAGKLGDMAMYFCKYANKNVDPCKKKKSVLE